MNDDDNPFNQEIDFDEDPEQDSEESKEEEENKIPQDETSQRKSSNFGLFRSAGSKESQFNFSKIYSGI